MDTYWQPRHRRELAPTSIYENNYAYTINFYQPMIDYLDEKQKYGKSEYPHLPWWNELALKKYSAHKSVQRYYTSDEASRYAKELASNAKEREYNLEDYKVIRRQSPLAVTKSAVGARIEKHLHQQSIEENYLRKYRERETKRQQQNIMEDIERIKAKYNTKNVEISSGLKSAIRGKTASQITAAILSESNKNIKNIKNEEQMFIDERKSRGVSESRIICRKMKIDICDDKMLDHLDSSMTTSLGDVKHQLHGFNRRTEDLYLQSRCPKLNFKYY